MVPTDRIKPKMEIVGNDGELVGVVDGIENGAELRLTKGHQDGMHHFLPLETVEAVDERVHLNRTSIRAMAEWR
ncbi:MAG TPA: DUF2171 domain-containing protein [Pseudolabrys sp.]|nr:DUF2171 domain-containing protein [Pseudolabrys sp.]